MSISEVTLLWYEDTSDVSLGPNHEPYEGAPGLCPVLTLEVQLTEWASACDLHPVYIRGL
jgi:hypothetical protein